MNYLSIPVLKRLYPSIIRRYLMLIGKIKNNIKINDCIFEIDIRESIERKTYFLKEYEKKRMDQLNKFRNEINSKIFIDVGANIGFYSISFSNKFEKVYSFEPNKRNFIVLKKNIEANNLKNIKVFNYGLGDKEEVLLGKSNTKGELFQTSGFALSKKNLEGESVLIKKGDDFLQFKEKKIIVKIDVEGFELYVLKGLEKTLTNNICVLQIEIWKKTNNEVLKFLNSLNYKMICSVDGDSYFSNYTSS